MQRLREIIDELRTIPVDARTQSPLYMEMDTLMFGLIAKFLREFAAMQGVTIFQACYKRGLYTHMNSKFGFQTEPRIMNYISYVLQARRKVEALAGDVDVCGDVLARVFLCLV